MSWTHVRNEFMGFAHRVWRRIPDRAPWTTGAVAICSWGDAQAADHDHRQPDKAQIWRRRRLQRKGAHLRMAMAGRGGEYSLAMLDEAGIVVSCYDNVSIDNAAVGADAAVDTHMRQFYVLTDIAAGVPQRDLRIAVAKGMCIEHGWRRRAGGAVYWGTTTIQPVVNRNEQLQGFSHMTRPSARPRDEYSPGQRG